MGLSAFNIALDATYSLGDDLSGVGVYSHEILYSLAAAHPERRLTFCYRPHAYTHAFRSRLPANCRRSLLQEPFPLFADLFHGLNQRLPRRRYRRTVSTFHDLFVLTGEYSTPEFRRRFAAQARHAAATSDAIIAVSEFTANQVESLLGVEKARVHAIHHGIRPIAAKSLPKENIVLHTGAIQRRKNIARLVEAFACLPSDWRLALAGSVGFGGADILRRIEQSPCSERISVLGYVPSSELADWYARARIFAFPSLDEGFGMPVLEAMAAGVPVIASNRAALPEVCGDAALLIDPEDTAALASALSELARNDDLVANLRERGFRRVAQFSWEKAAEQTWKVYESLLR